MVAECLADYDELFKFRFHRQPIHRSIGLPQEPQGRSVMLEEGMRMSSSRRSGRSATR
jgi:hypothetical protein